MYNRRYTKRRNNLDEERESQERKIKFIPVIVLLVVVLSFGLLNVYRTFGDGEFKNILDSFKRPRKLEQTTVIKEQVSEPVNKALSKRDSITDEQLEQELRKYVLEYFTMEENLENYKLRWRDDGVLRAMSSDSVFNMARERIVQVLFENPNYSRGIRNVRILSATKKSSQDGLETWEFQVLFNDKILATGTEDASAWTIVIQGGFLTDEAYNSYVRKITHYNFAEKNPSGFIVLKIFSSKN